MTLTKDEMERLARKISAPVGETKKQTEASIRAFIDEPGYSAGEVLRNNGRVILQELGASRLANRLFGG